jgi:hypothetical protein
MLYFARVVGSMRAINQFRLLWAPHAKCGLNLQLKPMRRAGQG